MAQLDPQMLAALMPAESAFGDDTFKHHFDKMSDEERLKEALNRNALDNQMLSLYHECFTDRHLDLAALLMEQHTESQKDPANPDMQFTPEALNLIPWAKAVVTMQLIHIASQSTTTEDDKAKIGTIQAGGQEVIALNYQRCKEQINNMLAALNDAGTAEAQDSQPSPTNKAVVDQVTANIKQNEQQMKTILERLESGVDETTAMNLAVEYAAIKAATAVMMTDLEMQDPQKMMHDDWMIDNFTKPLQQAASEVLKSSAYPELKVWANAMDSLTAFTQQSTVEMINSLLLNVANAHKANQQNIQSKLGRRTSRAVQAATQLNRATYFLRALCALDEEDWGDASTGLTAEARALASKLAPEDEVLQEWASNVSLLEQYAKEVEKNIDVVIEEREKYGSVIMSLLHSANSTYENFINSFDASHIRIAEHVEPGTVLDRWAAAVKEVSVPPDYKMFETIHTYNRVNKGAISKHEKSGTNFNSGLLYLKNMIVLPANEWKAIVRSSKCKVTDSVPANAVEWAFAATELRDYLQRTEERMKIISEEYRKHKLEIDSSNMPSPEPTSITPPTAPSQVPLDEIVPPTPLLEEMERKHTTPAIVKLPEPVLAPELSAPVEVQVLEKAKPATEEAKTVPEAKPEEAKPEPEKAKPEPEVKPEEAESAPEAKLEETKPEEAKPEEVKPAPEAKPEAVPEAKPAPEEAMPASVPEPETQSAKQVETGPGRQLTEAGSLTVEPATPAQEPSASSELSTAPAEKLAEVEVPKPVPPREEEPVQAKTEPSVLDEQQPPKEETAAEGVSTPKKRKKKKSVSSVGDDGEVKKKKKKKRRSVASDGCASPSKRSEPEEVDEDEVESPTPTPSAPSATVPAVEPRVPVPPQDDHPKPSRVIQIRPVEERPMGKPLDLLADTDSEGETTDAKMVYVKPKKQTLSQAVRENPQIARGIIFIQPRDRRE